MPRRPRRARRRAPGHDRRGRGRGRARGAAARVAAPARLARGGRGGPAAAPPPRATPRANGTPAGATRASSIAAPGWPRRWTGPPRTTPSSTRPSARSWPTSRAASERAHRRLRAVLAGVAALLALAVVAGVVALEQRGDARDEAIAADAQRLGARALAEDDLDRALLLARQGVALDDSLQTRGNLLAALLKSPAAIGVLRGDGDGLIGARPQPGRAHAGVHRQRRHAELRRHAHPATDRTSGDRRRSRRPHHRRQVRLDHVRFSPDGSRLAVGGGGPVVLDTRTHRVLARLRFASTGSSTAALLARRAYAVRRSRAPVGPAIIRRFDARSGRPLGRPARRRAVS